MKIFLIGHLRHFEETKEKFQPIADNLRTAHYQVINPLEIRSVKENYHAPAGECIRYLMTCDSIFLLNDWQESQIARVCFYIAASFNYRIYMEHDMEFLVKSCHIKLPDSPRKIELENIVRWLDDKIENCKDVIAISEAMDDYRKRDFMSEELKNYEKVMELIPASHA